MIRPADGRDQHDGAHQVRDNRRPGDERGLMVNTQARRPRRLHHPHTHRQRDSHNERERHGPCAPTERGGACVEDRDGADQHHPDRGGDDAQPTRYGHVGFDCGHEPSVGGRPPLRAACARGTDRRDTGALANVAIAI